MTKCKIVRGLAAELARWLQHQPAVGEESLTDWLLFQFDTKVPDTAYRKFNRWEEGVLTGADWEWWLLTRSVAWGLRVQAKKLSQSSDNYPSIAYSNRRGLQIDLLRSNAASRDLKAMYCFYYPTPPQSGPVLCQGGRSRGSRGAFLASATSVYERFIRVRHSKLDADAVLVETMPIECFFCCPMMRDGPSGVADFVEMYFTGPRSEANTADYPDEPSGLFDEPPEYVRSLIEYREEIPDWWDEEMAPQGVSALMVTDLR